MGDQLKQPNGIDSLFPVVHVEDVFRESDGRSLLSLLSQPIVLTRAEWEALAEVEEGRFYCVLRDDQLGVRSDAVAVDEVFYGRSSEPQSSYYPGILQHYDMNFMGSVVGVMPDISEGGSNPATLQNVVLSSDGRYLVANGVDSLVKFRGDMTPSYTLMGVFMLEPDLSVPSALYPRLIDSGGANNRYPGVYASRQGVTGSFSLSLYGHGKDTSFVPQTIPPFNELFHLALRFNGFSVDLFINGVFRCSVASSAVSTGWSLTSLLGSIVSANRQLVGGFCNFMRYGSALPVFAIGQNYAKDKALFIDFPLPDPSELGDYADIGGVMLKRVNEPVSDGVGTVFGDNTFFTEAEAHSTFGDSMPVPSEFKRMFSIGFTYDANLKGVWVGENHAMMCETVKSTFIPFVGYIQGGSGVHSMGGSVGRYQMFMTHNKVRSSYISADGLSLSSYFDIKLSVRLVKPLDYELGDYANINGLFLKRTHEIEGADKNYDIAPLSGKGDIAFYKHDTALSLFGSLMPTLAEWETMLETGFTYEPSVALGLKGVWIGENHALGRETDKSTLIKFQGYWDSSGNYQYNTDVTGLYWANEVSPRQLVAAEGAASTDITLHITRGAGVRLLKRD